MTFLFLGISSASADGCCVYDVKNGNKGADNCKNDIVESNCPGGTDEDGLFLKEKKCPTSIKNRYCSKVDDTKEKTPTGGTVEFANPLKFTTVSEVLNALLGNLQGIIVMIAVIFIVVGGIMYMLSSSNEEMINRAKSTIGGAVIGLSLALAAPTFLKEIKTILGGQAGKNADDIVAKALTIKEVAERILTLLLSVIGIIGIIGLVIGGVFYLTAYGDEDRINKAKTIITSSLIGIAIAFAASIIVRQVANLLGVA